MRNTVWPRYRSHHLDGAPCGDRAAFFLGQGPGARPLARLRADATPAALLRTPVGHRLLTATTALDYRRAVAALIRPREQAASVPEDLHCPPAGRGALEWLRYRPPDGITHLYAFDRARVRLWLRDPDPEHPAGQWHRLDLPAQHSDDPVWLIPEHRIYGTGFVHTAGLDLPQLATWIMAEATFRGQNPGSALSVCLGYGASVDPDTGWITISVFGLPDHIIHRQPGGPAADIRREIASIADNHDWLNPADTYDRRLWLNITLLTQARQRQHAARRAAITIDRAAGNSVTGRPGQSAPPQTHSV